MSRLLLAGAYLLAFVIEATPNLPNLRLPETVAPVRYSVELTVVPGTDRFRGTTEIEVDVRTPSSVIWIHGKSLEFESVQIRTGIRTVTARAEQHENDFVALLPAAIVPAGRAQLRIVYKGEISRNLTDGLFQQQYEGQWYVFTKFEPVTARRAFPCFDEPSFKTPWDITLHVPKQLSAFSNSPEASESEDSAGNLKTIRFASGKPLPSYLVALAVGPFDVVDAGRAGKNQIPLRMIVPRGRGKDAANAAAATPGIISRLENYFGISFPYDKLDQLVVPVTTAWGAMENAGLIAYGQTLLAVPQDDTELRQRARMSTMTHEIAHQWFGDLVTPRWWDDLWLNEAFASWLSRKMLDESQPDWKLKFDGIVVKNLAMNADRLVTARKLRQPIAAPGDIANAFDAITYSKGSSVLAMFENYAGADAFRQGVHDFLSKYAWKSATASDFLAALNTAAGRDAGSAFSTFLDQGGVPLVHLNLSCRPNASPVIEIKQERFLPAGSAGNPAATWKLPLCMRWSEGTDSERQCVLVSKPQDEIPLKSARTCPSWVFANENGAGYYRTIYGDGLMNKLLARGMPNLKSHEKVSVLHDVQALFSSGRMDAGEALRTTERFSGDSEREVIQTTMDIFGAVREATPENLKPNLQRFIRTLYGHKAHELGWTPSPEDSRDVRLLRASVLSLVAFTGGDDDLRLEGAQLGRKWLDNRAAVNPDLAAISLSAATWTGDRPLFDRLVQEIRKTRVQRDRLTIVGAMRMFGNDEIMRSALELLFDRDLDPREFTTLLTPARKETRLVVWNFVKENFDKLNARLPGARGITYAAVLPLTAAGFCDESSRSDVKSFFENRIGALSGGARNLSTTLESIRLCEASVIATQPAIAEFLANNYGAAK